jgi:hypothetical protein
LYVFLHWCICPWTHASSASTSILF